MVKIQRKRLNDESEFEHIADIYSQYIEALKKFPKGTQQEQLEFIIGFGKDINNLLIVLQIWMSENDKTKGN